MNEIKCPNCGTVFQIDEQDYESIVKQIRDKEFEQEIKLREEQYKKDKEQTIKIMEIEASKKLEEELSKKKLEIVNLQRQIETTEQEIKLTTEKKYTEEIKQKEIEITKLKGEIQLKNTEKELALKEITNNKDKEIESLNTIIETNKNEYLIKEHILKEKYE